MLPYGTPTGPMAGVQATTCHLPVAFWHNCDVPVSWYGLLISDISLLPGELAKHAVSEGTKALTKYTYTSSK